MSVKERIRRQASQVSGFITSLDLFKEPIPGFNIEGRAGVGTLIGSLLSISLVIVMTLYGEIKFDILVNRLNPTITLTKDQQEFDDEMTLVNLRDDASMRFAFSVRSLRDKKTLLDPRYVKIITRIRTFDADWNETEQIIGHHACTDEEYAQFAEPSELFTK